MRTAEELQNELRGMDRRSYPAYKALAGTWQFEKYRLTIDHVQGDPFASPSSLQGDSLKNAISRPGDPARAV